MENQNPMQDIKSKKSDNTNTASIRVLKSTAKKLRSLALKLNKKSYGRKIKADDIIIKSLSLLEEKHLEQIKAASLSNSDRINIAYKNHCKTHPGASKDDFLGLLLDERKP